MHPKTPLSYLHSALLDEIILYARVISHDLKQMEKAGYKPDQPRAPRGQPNGGQWTRGANHISEKYNWGKPETLEDHFTRHGKRLGIKSSTAYARKASEFLQNAKNKGFSALEYPKSGKIAIYEPSTNTLGIYNRNGSTASLFQPKEGTNYFQKLKNTQLSRGGRMLPSLPSNFGGGPALDILHPLNW